MSASGILRHWQIWYSRVRLIYRVGETLEGVYVLASL